MAILILKVELDEDKITSILSRLDDIRKELDRLAYDANAVLRGTITEEHFEASEDAPR